MSIYNRLYWTTCVKQINEGTVYLYYPGDKELTNHIKNNDDKVLI